MTTESDIKTLHYIMQSVASVPQADDPAVVQALREAARDLTVDDLFGVIGGMAAMTYGLAQRLAAATGQTTDDILAALGATITAREAGM